MIWRPGGQQWGDQDTVPAGIPYAPPPLFHASPDPRHRHHHHNVSILLYLLNICYNIFNKYIVFIIFTILSNVIMFTHGHVRILEKQQCFLGDHLITFKIIYLITR